MVTESLSEDVRVALRPFSTYRELGRSPAKTLRAALWGPVFWLFVVACFVSWTTSGGLLPEHFVFGPLAWMFVPVVQSVVAVVVAQRIGGVRSVPRVLRLYYLGHAPWFVLLCLVAGICLVVPEPWWLFSWLLRSGVLLALVVGAFGWCVLLTYAMFRSGFALSRQRSASATATHYLLCTLVFTSWFLITGQLLPLWGIM